MFCLYESVSSLNLFPHALSTTESFVCISWKNLRRSQRPLGYTIIGLQPMLWASYLLSFAQSWRGSSSFHPSTQSGSADNPSQSLFCINHLSISVSQFQDLTNFPYLVSLPKTSTKLQISYKQLQLNLQKSNRVTALPKLFKGFLHYPPGIDSHTFFSGKQALHNCSQF